MRLNHAVNVEERDVAPAHFFPFGVGIDCHKDFHWACVLRARYDRGDQERAVCKFMANRVGLAEMHRWLNNQVPLGDRRFLVEATSTYHFPILLELSDWQPSVLNAQLVGGSKKKTDRWDAQKLAHHSMVGTFRPYIPPTATEQALRIAYRRWHKIRGTMRRSCNALQSRMCIYGVTDLGNLSSARGWAIACALCNGRMPLLGEVPEDTLESLLSFEPLLRHVPLQVIKVNRLQIAEVESLRVQEQAAWEVVRDCVPAGAMGLLRSVPSVSEKGAACFIAEVGEDPRRRFNSVRAVIAFTGFDPSRRVSADKIAGHGAAAGSRWTRQYFRQCAMGVMNSNGPLGMYGRAVRDRIGKGGFKAATYAIGRRLVRYCTSVLVAREPFVEGLYHGTKAYRGWNAGTERERYDSDFDIGEPAGPGDILKAVCHDEGFAPIADWEGEEA